MSEMTEQQTEVTFGLIVPHFREMKCNLLHEELQNVTVVKLELRQVIFYNPFLSHRKLLRKSHCSLASDKNTNLRWQWDAVLLNPSRIRLYSIQHLELSLEASEMPVQFRKHRCEVSDQWVSVNVQLHSAPVDISTQLECIAVVCVATKAWRNIPRSASFMKDFSQCNSWGCTKFYMAMVSTCPFRSKAGLRNAYKLELCSLFYSTEPILDSAFLKTGGIFVLLRLTCLISLHQVCQLPATGSKQLPKFHREKGWAAITVLHFRLLYNLFCSFL